MKTILVPTDYSKEARQAFVYALELAKTANSDLVLFHAFQEPLRIENAYYLEEAILVLEKEKTERLTEWAIEVKNDLKNDFCWQYDSIIGKDLEEQTSALRTKSGFHSILVPAEPNQEIKITCVCKFGLVTEEINNVADTYKADLVVISSRGAGAIGQAILGSTVAGVIACSQVPVLTLPQQAKYKKLEAFVFAFDLNKLPDNAILKYLRNMVNTFKANLQVLHFYKGEDAPLEQKKVLKGLDNLDEQLFDISYKVYFQKREDVVAGIHEFVQQHQTDLLVLIPRHHTFLELLLNKSVTEKITHESFVPFLTLPYPSSDAVAGTKHRKEVEGNK